MARIHLTRYGVLIPTAAPGHGCMGGRDFLPLRILEPLFQLLVCLTRTTCLTAGTARLMQWTAQVVSGFLVDMRIALSKPREMTFGNTTLMTMNGLILPGIQHSDRR